MLETLDSMDWSSTLQALLESTRATKQASELVSPRNSTDALPECQLAMPEELAGQAVDWAPLGSTAETATPIAPLTRAPLRREYILGIPIDNVSMTAAVHEVLECLEDEIPTRVCFVNADCVNIAFRDAAYAHGLRHANLVFADGVGMRWAGRALGRPIVENVNGTDMFPQLCRGLVATDRSVFLLGGRPGVAEDVAAWMTKTYRDIRIAGTRNGYFTAEEEPQVVAEIAASGAELLLVAMGDPRQTLWIEQHLPKLGVRVAMGVGGLFDFFSGRVPRAPLWMRQLGLEWLYRLYQEPRRLWRRYVVGNVIFLARLGLVVLGLPGTMAGSTRS